MQAHWPEHYEPEPYWPYPDPEPEPYWPYPDPEPAPEPHWPEPEPYGKSGKGSKGGYGGKGSKGGYGGKGSKGGYYHEPEPEPEPEPHWPEPKPEPHWPEPEVRLVGLLLEFRSLESHSYRCVVNLYKKSYLIILLIVLPYHSYFIFYLFHAGSLA